MKAVYGSIVLIFTIFSAPAFSATGDTTTTVKFNYWESHSMYACSYVENQALGYVNKLGGTDASVDCKGGLPWNNWVSAEITFKPSMDKSLKETKIRVNQSCDFNQKLIEKLLPAFNPTDVKRKGVCWDSNGRLRYTITH